MKLIRIYFSAGLMAVAQLASGQVSADSLLVLPDSVRPLTIDNFYAMLLENHPVAKQADLLSEFARQEMRLARGNFDPELEAQYLAKESRDVEYYRILHSSIKFPSMLPLVPIIGAEQNTGKYLNPERFISAQHDFRQFFVGISLPLLRGLITDDRRAALRQAALFGDMTEAEQVKIVNNLFLDAAKDYWQWSMLYYNFSLYTQSVKIAEDIFRRVKLNNELGEAAPVDTIQAKITLQQRLVERQEALLEFENAGIQLSNYLWDSLGNPLALPKKFAPVLERNITGTTREELEELKILARTNHPELQKLDVKLQQLEVDRRLAAENLKPELNVKYSFLNQPFETGRNSSFQLDEDYKFGVDFSFPLFIRKERAKLAQFKLKISNTRLERSFTERQLLNQIDASYNQLVSNGLIIREQSEMVNNYNRLLQAELINLENGESDLFKINIQIEKLMQSQSKLINLLAHYQKQKAFLYWAAGVRRLH